MRSLLWYKSLVFSTVAVAVLALGFSLNISPMQQTSTFELDYDGRTGERIYIPEYDPKLHIKQWDLYKEMQSRIPGVGFNETWRAIPAGGQVLVKERRPHGQKAYIETMYRNRLNDLEKALHDQ